MNGQALAGIRVVDLTRVVAGPLAGQLLADLGADVIKVERRGEGDDVRRVGPPWLKDRDGRDSEESTYFQSVNRGKRSITVDFTQAEGAELIRRLVAEADVVLENYRTGTLGRYGLGYDDLAAINPRLIYCSITGFGMTGPYADRSGYDYLAQAMAGLMSVTGLPDGQPGAGPTRVGVPIADICAGMNAAIGILAALNYRHASGRGQHLEVSLFDSQLAAMLNTFTAWFNGGTALPRSGNDHPSAAPYGVYPVADGHILIATFNDREFGRLAEALGHPEWTDDPRFARNGARVANRPTLAAAITEVLSDHGKAYWMQRLHAAKISAGPINTMADIEHDPQVAAREMVVRMAHPLAGEVRVPGNPIKLSGSPVVYRRPPPLIGEHTAEVLGEVLALSPAVIDDLRARNVI